MKRTNLLEKQGLGLLSLPITRHNKTNEKRRDVADLQQTTAAQMLSLTRVSPHAPMLLCGRQNKLLPFLRCLTRMVPAYVLIGTPRDFADGSCLRTLPCDWEAQQPSAHLPDGNGRLTVRPGATTTLALKECLSDWDSHLPILCLGSGLKLDAELLNLLDGIGNYVLVTESLSRSVKDSENCPLSVEKLVASMDYIVVSSIGTAAKELLSVLPTYECEKVTNVTDFSLHQDSPYQEAGGHHRLHGLGGRLSQSRTLEEKSILTQDELTALQDDNMVLVYNAQLRHAWVGRVTR
ncbi:MAG: hypothetical protein LUD84_01885 [Clostridiales bacterium]|nr:hypothetical protein [Clostridiales bacterium]